MASIASEVMAFAKPVMGTRVPAPACLAILSKTPSPVKRALKNIKEICYNVLKEFGVEYAYLFGSYAKGKAKITSDVDLLVSMPVNGLAFYELIETLREKLKKKVDLLDIAQLNNNPKLVQEILRDGVKIYG